MWVFFSSFPLVQSDLTFFCLGFLVWYRFVSDHSSYSEDSFILRFDRDAYKEGPEITDEGVEEAFEVVASLKLFLFSNNQTNYQDG
jgi:hypothetical protein